MATRFYFPSSGTAPASPAYGAMWEQTSSAARLPLLTTKSNTAFVNVSISETTGATPWDVLTRQYISDTLPAGDIGGTFSYVMAANEAVSSADMFLQVRIAVVSGDGSTVRGELYSGQTATSVSATATDPNYELAGGFTSRYLSGVSLSTVTAQSGDRLVVEIGYRSVNTVSTSRTGTLQLGDSTSIAEHVLNTTETSQKVPWIEFSQNVFVAPGPDVTLAGSVDAVTGSFTVTNSTRMDLAGSVPEVTGAFTATVLARMDLAGSVPAPTGSFTLAFEDQILSLSGVVSGPTGSFTMTNSTRMDLAGVVPGVVGAFSLFPREDVTLDGQVSGVTGSFSLADTSAVSLTLAGSVGVVLGSFTVSTGYIGVVRDDRIGGLSIGMSMPLEFTPAVVAAPPGSASANGRRRISAAAFTNVDTTGTVATYDVDTANRRRLRERIVIGGKDATHIFGVETSWDYQLVSPLLYGPGTVRLPGIKTPFREVGKGSLSWLDKGKAVKVQLLDESDNVTDTLYRGLVLAWDIDGTDLTVQLGGEAQGRAAMEHKPLPVYSTPRSSAGRRIYNLIRGLGLPFNPFLGPNTPAQSIPRLGGMSVLECIEYVCRNTQRRDGTQFSVMPGNGGAYRFEAKDTTTVHATVYVDGTRVKANVRSDMVDEPNRIFATATTPEGRRLSGIVAPGIVQGPPPPFAGNMSEGDTGGQVPVLIDRLQGFDLLDEAQREGFDSDVTEAVKDLQEAADLPQTGVVNEATWKALFDLDVTGYSLRLARRDPAAQRSEVRRWNTTPTGAIIRGNPGFRRGVPKVDAVLDMGSNISARQRKRWARAELNKAATPNWSGTLEVTTGAVIAGNHHFGDPLDAGDLMDTRLLKPGMNIMLRGFQDDEGTLFHISGVDGAPTSQISRTFLIDTRARDTLHVWDAVRRRREEDRWRKGRRASTEMKDVIGEWDGAGGGKLRQAVEIPAETWVVFGLPAGDEGTISRFHIKTNVNAEFAAAFFGGPLVPKALEQYLARKIPSPLTEDGTAAWDDRDINQKLKDNGLLGVWGEHLDPGGYEPRAKSRGGELTGVLADDAGIAYRTARFPVLYVAVWADRDTTIPAGRIMWNQLEPGA